MAGEVTDKPITLKIIQALWPIGILLVTIGIMWANINAKINEQTVEINQIKIDIARVESSSLTRDEKLTETLDKHLNEVSETKALRDEQYLKLSVDLATIQTDIAYIRSEMDRITDGQYTIP